MLINIEAIKKTIVTIGSTGKNLADLIIPWAENRGILGPFQRYLQDMQSKAPQLSLVSQELVSQTFGLLQVMKEPRLLHRFKADEHELPRTLLGPELQLLNNVQYHKPWKFDFFQLLEQIEPDVYKIQSIIDQEISLIILSEGTISQSFLPLSVEQGWVIGAILIPLGELQMKDSDSDQGTREIPGVMNLSPILEIPYFSQKDLGYLLQSTASKKGLTLPESDELNIQNLWNMVEGFLLPGFLLLAQHPELLEVLDLDEKPNSMAYQKITLDEIGIPPSTMNNLLIDFVETQLEQEEFHSEQRSSWLMFESLKEIDGLVQPRQIFFCQKTNQLLIRTLGVDPKPGYYQLTHSIQRFLSHQENSKHAWIEKVLPLEPEIVVSLTALLLGQDLFGIDVPGPPKHLIDGLLLGY